MEVITTILLCAVGLLAYLANANNNEVLRLKNLIREKEITSRNLLDEKDNEISKINQSLQQLKMKTIPIPIKNNDEISKLKRELDKNRGEISTLQKKLRESEITISDLQVRIKYTENRTVENKSINFVNIGGDNSTQKENERLRIQVSELQRENSSLKMLLNATQNDNEQFKIRISELRRENSILKSPVAPPPPPTPKKFVKVVFGFSDKKYDYLVGKHKDVKIGDFVMVPAKGELKSAKVVYVSKPGEISPKAKSEII